MVRDYYTLEPDIFYPLNQHYTVAPQEVMTMANTHEVLDGIKEYTLELLGTSFRDAAEASATRSESAATRSESAATRSEGAAESATGDAAATAADRVATGKDRTQTGKDAEAAEGWAGQSEVSAALAITAAATVTQFVGDGFPEGKVAAPVGSIYTDRLATSGAVRWVKTQGSGNTGWQVEYGDTGWRDLTNMYVGYLGGTLQVRRVNSNVTWSMEFLTAEDQPPSWNQHNGIVRPGFRPNSHLYFAPAYINDKSATGAFRIGSNGVLYTYGSKPERRFDLVAQYPTGDAWPSTLPGTPA